MTSFGISNFGAYVPRFRLERSAIAAAHKWMAPSLRGLGKGARAFASWDEDAITMAVEAARSIGDGQTFAGVSQLTFASTRAPYADLQNSTLICSALRLDEAVETVDMGGGQRAGVSALLSALRAGRETLVVASDNPIGKPASVQEMAYGAGAAAFLTGSDNLAAVFLGGASRSVALVDHFRASGENYDYFWEERWVRDEGYMKIAPQAINAALEDAGVSVSDIAYMAMPSLLRKGASATAKAIGFSGEIIDELPDQSGYAGAAHAPLLLTAALEKASAGEKILLVGFGQGTDAIVLEATQTLKDLPARTVLTNTLGDSISTDAYLRMLSFSEQIGLEWGMRSEKNAKTALTEQHRAADQIDGFVAGKCSNCDTVQFPQLEYCVKPGCGARADEFKPMPLPDEPAEILTHTADWLSYHPAPPLYVGFVQFKNGARVLMEIADVGPDGIDVGTPVRMIYRIKEKDRARGYNRYFWKATPVSA